MSAESESGFVIRDRRGERPEPTPPAQEATPSKSPESGVSLEATAGRAAQPAVPLTFSSFVFSMGTSALMLMGEQLDPQQSPVPVNLEQAKEIIDILSILDTKTKGNLTQEEQSVLTDMLYALRMKFVDVTSGKPASSAR